MGITALRQLLKSFCTNLPWNYAVLWKLSLEGQMVLSWEDGYCDFPKPLKLMPGEVCRTGANDKSSLHCETSEQDGDSGGYSIGLVVANMSALQYSLGEGIVAEVANTGNHFWFSYDNVSTSKINSNLVPECPDEWLLQLALGIKTILLVPVLPHGVLQFGSLKVIAEDLSLVAYITNGYTFHSAGRNFIPSTLSSDIQTPSSSTLLSGIIKSLDESSLLTISAPKSDHSDTIDIVKPSKIMLSTFDGFVPLLSVQDPLQVSGEDLPVTFRNESKNKIVVPLVGFDTGPKSPSHSIEVSDLELMENKLFGLSCLEEEPQAYSPCDRYNIEILGELYGGGMNSYPVGDTMEELSRNKILNDTVHKTGSLNFPKDCELHKALGPVFHGNTNEYLWDSPLLVDKTSGSSSLISNRNLTNRNLTDGIESTWFTQCDSEYLLEAVVANVCCDSDDTSGICNSVKSSLTSSGQFVATLHPQSQYEGSVLIGDDSAPQSHFLSSCVVGDRNECSPTSTTNKSTLGTFIDEEDLEKGYNDKQSKKEPKISTVSKKRTKPGDNQRPRPRDRQLIQDRLKELRGLVPNGVKCSIDGLLDQTINHMLYLRSITDQAEKLRQWVHREMGSRKDSKSSETADGYQNGTTWAYEFGNDLLVCPIVVEDLAYPGHMLIEMLCNEHCLFLEIAQVIRNSQLTILKGVMESRSNNTWAHFIVEASKGFRRTDIFWPLMHLLQRKRNSISSKI